jgi:hypothetical protein
MGRPLLVRPQGTLMPGKPARLQLRVKTSARYMSTGLARSPRRNAAVGEVGDRMTSHCSKAWSKSRLMRARTCCAFL